MRNSKQALKRLAIALGALLLVSAVALSQVTVSLPTVTAKIGTTQSIPVTVGDLTGQGVVSYQFKVTYDPTLINVTGVTAGALVAGWNAPTANTGVSGQVTVAGAGTTNLSGSGVLVYLIVTTVGKGTSPLTFAQFQFNEGTPASTTTNGSVIVPLLSVKISDISTALPVGSTFTLPITSEALTGLGATSYQFTLTYDKTKINLTGVSLAGTLSANFSQPSVNLSTAGQMTVAAAGTNVLTGTGTLLNLTGTVVAVGGTSAVHFTAFQFNEGTPAAGGVDGSVTLGSPQKPTLTSRSPANLTTAAQNNIIPFVVHAVDPGGAALTFTWEVNGGLVKGPGPDSTYSVRFNDPHGTAKTVTCIYTSVAGLKDSTGWSFTITGVNDHNTVPTDFVLGQNYPNPFNPTTMISFSLPKEAPVTFEIYNMLGVKIRTLMAGETRSAATYTVTWDGKNDAGVGMPSGVYLYRVMAGAYVSAKKMTLLK